MIANGKPLRHREPARLAARARLVAARRRRHCGVRSNEIQTVTVTATGGTYTLSFDGATTAAIAFDAPANLADENTVTGPTSVERRLEDVATIDDVRVTRTGNVYTVEFRGALTARNVAQLTVLAALTGGTATVATAAEGGPATTGTPPSSFLVLDFAHESRTHNALYVPPHASDLKFSLRTFIASADGDELVVLLGTTPLGVFSLAAPTGAPETKSLAIHESLRHTVNTLGFAIRAGGSAVDAQVWIDEVEFAAAHVGVGRAGDVVTVDLTGGPTSFDDDPVFFVELLRTGTARSGSVSTIQLDTGASVTAGAYDLKWIRIISGTGVGQFRQITAYDGTSQTATVAGPTGRRPTRRAFSRSTIGS